MTRGARRGVARWALWGLGAAAALWALRRSDGDDAEVTGSPGTDWAGLWEAWTGDDVDTDTLLTIPEVRAFLRMIRTAEHTRADADSGRAYSVFYGGSTFTGWADHPVITGELAPVRLSADMCRAAGYASGVCYSTAAGAYQITRPTWDDIRAWRGPRLPDFSPASQDAAAVRLLVRAGAIEPLQWGDVAGAIRAASSRWASLPGNTAGQPQRPLSTLLAYYRDFLAQQ